MHKTGCLIIHGFTGGPFEVEPLARYLKQRGFVTLCPTLAGHGPDKENLAKITWQDWLQTAEESFMSLAEKCSQVIIIGFSMGGLLAINLVLKYPVKKLVTISSPIYPLHLKQLARNIASDLANKNYRYLVKYVRNSSRTPLKAVISLLYLIRHTKPLLAKVDTPLLVIQGLADDTVHPQSAEYIYKKAGSKYKLLKKLPSSGHLVCLDSESREAFEAIYAFLADKSQM